MPRPTPEGFTHVEDAEAKWGRKRAWWYTEIREGRLVGYKSPLYQGTFLKDEDVEAYIAFKPISRQDDPDQRASG